MAEPHDEIVSQQMESWKGYTFSWQGSTSELAKFGTNDLIKSPIHIPKWELI